jgi:hypothetical protein
MRRAAAIGGAGESTSERKPVRWRARSSVERQAGTTSTKRNSAALSSSSEEVRSIAFVSIALIGCRAVEGSAAASSDPTENSSRSSLASSMAAE